MNTTPRTRLHSLLVAEELVRFVDDEVLPGTGIDRASWWAGFDAIVRELAPKNAALLAERDRLQAELDAWHAAHPGPIGDMPAYRAFLQRIGYLVAPPAGVHCRTAQVDEEVAPLAGPQLVVPILNARYALNAANARWGSLYDALYGTDVIPASNGAEKGAGYNPVRGQKVIGYARNVLDQAAPLAGASHCDAAAYQIKAAADGARLTVVLKDGTVTGLAAPSRFVGYQGEAAAPSSVLLRHHGLHLDIRIDRNHPICERRREPHQERAV